MRGRDKDVPNATAFAPKYEPITSANFKKRAQAFIRAHDDEGFVISPTETPRQWTQWVRWFDLADRRANAKRRGGQKFWRYASMLRSWATRGRSLDDEARQFWQATVPCEWPNAFDPDAPDMGEVTDLPAPPTIRRQRLQSVLDGFAETHSLLGALQFGTSLDPIRRELQLAEEADQQSVRDLRKSKGTAAQKRQDRGQIEAYQLAKLERLKAEYAKTPPAPLTPKMLKDFGIPPKGEGER